MKIIDYIPQKKTPVIVYETERLDTSRIKISAENYQLRKIKYQQQVDSVIDYATNNQKCRSVLLLEYFGQSESEPCGACDVCKGDHELGIKTADFNRISSKIKNLLLSEPCQINLIVKKITEPETVVVKVTRWLLDNGELLSDPNGILTITSL